MNQIFFESVYLTSLTPVLFLRHQKSPNMSQRTVLQQFGWIVNKAAELVRQVSVVFGMKAALPHIQKFFGQILHHFTCREKPHTNCCEDVFLVRIILLFHSEGDICRL